MKTLKKIFAGLFIATMFFAVSCSSSDDDSESESQTEKTGGNQNPPQQTPENPPQQTPENPPQQTPENPPQQTPENPPQQTPEELPPKSTVNINEILIELGAGYDEQATSFKPSATAPASGVTTHKIHNDIDTAVVWLDVDDGTTIYYYAEGYTDSEKGIPLGDSAKEMFKDCFSLETIDMSGFDTSNVTDMSDMFNGCKKLTSLNLSNFNTSKVTNMTSMFYNCEKLTKLDLLKFDTSKVKNMSNMFDHCEGLTSLDVSSFDTSNVTDMTYMFFFCSNLTSLDVSSFDTSNVTNMSYMFVGCEKLTTIYTKNDADWGSDRGDDFKSTSMFDICNSLKGGNGTEYSYDHRDAKYAREDGLNGKPGYFTAKTE